MKRSLLVLILLCCVAVFLPRGEALGATCTVTFTDGSVLRALQLTNLQACVNNVDRQNIGAAGIDATQIAPLSLSAAIFGGSYPYTFPVSVIGNAAAATPSPAPTGYYGPLVVAQATNAPTVQPGYMNVFGSTISGPGNGSVPFLKLTVTTSPSPPANPYVISNIQFKDMTYGGTISSFSMGVVDDGAGNFGSYGLWNTSVMGTSDLQLETLQVVPNGHVGMPYDILTPAVSSPNGCAALATCAQATVTFTRSYVTNKGAAAAPICYAPGIQDLTTPTVIWTGNVNSLSATAAVYNYAPNVTTTGVHSLVFTSTCHEAGF